METVTNYVEDLHGVLASGILTERRSFIKSFIKEAVVKGNDVKLEYTFPMLQKGPKRDKSVVLSIVHDGGAEGTVDRIFSLMFNLV
jgi:hypothetical protein